MSYEPCQNPNCKSFGKPHPNCRCHGSFAEGGDVRFCAESRAHSPDCEYSANGGDVGHVDAIDHSHWVAGHIMNYGLGGIVRMNREQDLTKYEKSIKYGHKKLGDFIDGVFENGKHPPEEDREKHHKFIEDWMTKGGISHQIQDEVYKQNAPQLLAKGGDVTPHHGGVLHNHPVETAYPDQNIMLNAAKGRVSEYLNSLRPHEDGPRLAFDHSPDQTEQKKDYKRAVKIADSPLSVLREVSRGTVIPEHIKHLSGMYPEVLTAIQKKMTEKIVHAQLEGKRPNAKTRQSLSLLMGTSLSGELTPQGIQAAQATFIKSPQPNAGAQAPKKKQSTSHLSKSDQSYLTGQQALTARQQRQS